LKSYEESTEIEGKKITGCLIKLENATIILFDEKEEIRLGTLAAGIPDLGGEHYLTSVLLGERNETEAKLLAERVSAMDRGIAIVSVHLEPLSGLNSLAPLMKLASALIEKSRKAQE
jgi:hypothetical protein